MNIDNSSRLAYQLLIDPEPDFLFQLDQDPEVMRFINGGNKTSRQQITEQFIPRIASFTHAELGWGVWKVSQIDRSKAIGWVLVRPMGFFTGQKDTDDLELGWRFARASWNKGYATEAANHILVNIAKRNNNTFFSAIAVEENEASIAVMKKIGMSYVKSYLHTDPIFSEQVVLYQMPAR